MKLSEKLHRHIIEAMQARHEIPSVLSDRIGVDRSTLSRILSRKVARISDSTADKLSRGLNITLPEMLILSAGGELKNKPSFVAEPAVDYSADVWDDLARWARSDRVSAKARQHVLNAAELAGFTSERLSSAQSALLNASSQEDDDAEKKPAVA